MSRVRSVDLRDDLDPDLEPVLEHLRAGGVLAYPTETVYGLGALCTAEGVRAVRRLKGRGEAKPLIALAASLEDLEALDWTADARELARVFWPGSLTLVLRDRRGIFPAGMRGGTGTVGVRMSPHPFVTSLLARLGAPITSTSLNVPGEPPATSSATARAVLERLPAGDVLLIDLGMLPPSGPSTVVDCSGTATRVIREGTVPVHRLRCAIPEIH